VAIEVHVEGQVVPGRMPDFAEAVGRYRDYAVAHGYAAPDVLLGLSGPMNTVRLVYRYEDLTRYNDHEFKAMTDREYGRVADAMGFAAGTLTYTIYRRL
jgi:hypothetical protein